MPLFKAMGTKNFRLYNYFGVGGEDGFCDLVSEGKGCGHGHGHVNGHGQCHGMVKIIFVVLWSWRDKRLK
jgi:hypothetical protein